MVTGAGLRVVRLSASAVVIAMGCMLASCGKKNSENLQDPCVSGAPSVVTGSLGSAKVFFPDPVVRSGIIDLSPTSLRLDEFRRPVTLQHLGGHGVLEGQYVDVRNGIHCKGGFLASDPANRFEYSQRDPRFQEAMAYYVGDSFRASLDVVGYLQPKPPIQIITHWKKEDNAFFVRGRDVGNQAVWKVFLGDSAATPGASYGDDAIVTVHELQHGTTVETYSVVQTLNQFWYDEAGALNEAISDFAGLIYFAPELPLTADPVLSPKIFSRWALKTFIPDHEGTRGAHKCPTYDSKFLQDCSGFPGFSARDNTVSYKYPDGLGWPYAKGFQGSGILRNAFLNYASQEEIHNAGVLIEGALWDAYEALKSNHLGEGSSAAQTVARTLMTQLVLEGLKHLPKPNISTQELSPVSFRKFAASVVAAASPLGLSTRDQASVIQAFTARGLYGGDSLPSGWSDVGPGAYGVPGMRILDNPVKLKTWLIRIDSDPSLVEQNLSTGINNKLDPGEVVVVWFDIQNNSDFTAGGIQVTVTSRNPNVTFLDDRTNIGAISPSRAQIQYGKINGKTIVALLNPDSDTSDSYRVPTGNSYFQTNPFYDRNWSTGLWVKVSAGARHGEQAVFEVEALPSNGEASIKRFSTTIQ